MRWILLAVLLVVASPAQADIARTSCTHFFADSEDAPPEVRELLEPDSRAAVQVCTAWDDPDSRFLEFVYAPIYHPFGVCQVIAKPLFEGSGGWTFSPPEGKSYLGDRRVSMMPAKGDCPRQDDPRYIVTSDVSAGVFLTAVQFSKELSSANAHNALLAAVYPAVRSVSMFPRFESAVRSGAEFQLARVSFTPADARSPAFYRMDLEGAPTNWTLLFDVVDDGLVVVGIGTVEY